MPIPPVPLLDAYIPALAGMVAQTSFLPDAKTVQILRRAVFPTVRGMSRRLQPILRDGVAVGMYDDNKTPEWALFWAHGLTGTRPQGWTIAHVWPSGDIESYTHLANLLIVPECFASLTDKTGPLTQFLRWHAWSKYRWKPPTVAEPKKTEGFDQVTWRYLPPVSDPAGFIRGRLAELNNQRVQVLRPIMEGLGMV